MNRGSPLHKNIQSDSGGQTDSWQISKEGIFFWCKAIYLRLTEQSVRMCGAMHSTNTLLTAVVHNKAESIIFARF